MPFDLAQAIKELVAGAKEQGCVTYDELTAALPPDQATSEQIEEVLYLLTDLGIKLVDDPALDDPIDRESACSRASRRMEMAIAALRHGRVAHACRLLKTTLAELQRFAGIDGVAP
jgi:RNA polymerase primary sigma factor